MKQAELVGWPDRAIEDQLAVLGRLDRIPGDLTGEHDRLARPLGRLAAEVDGSALVAPDQIGAGRAGDAHLVGLPDQANQGVAEPHHAWKVHAGNGVDQHLDVHAGQVGIPHPPAHGFPERLTVHDVGEGKLDPHVGVGHRAGNRPGRLHGGRGPRLVPDNGGHCSGGGNRLCGRFGDAPVRRGIAGNHNMLAGLDEHDLLDQFPGPDRQLEAQVLRPRLDAADDFHPATGCPARDSSHSARCPR